MLEKEGAMNIPSSQRMERQKTIEREHTEEYEAAIRRAIRLHIPSVYSSTHYGTFQDTREEHSPSEEQVPFLGSQENDRKSG